MDPILIALTAGVNLWAQIRASFDPDIRRGWDLLAFSDYLELRKRLGMPLPPGLNLEQLFHSKADPAGGK